MEQLGNIRTTKKHNDKYKKKQTKQKQGETRRTKKNKGTLRKTTKNSKTLGQTQKKKLGIVMKKLCVQL